jgi:hypothetical protein
LLPKSGFQNGSERLERLGRSDVAAAGGIIMSKEKPTDDPRQRTDSNNMKQTDEPWKGPPEKEQKPSDQPLDLEKWQESDTH